MPVQCSLDTPDATVGKLIEAWNSHDIERVIRLYAPDCEGLDVGQPAHLQGSSNLRSAFESYLRAFPDLRITADEILIDGQRVALFWTAEGTHSGWMMNIPPTRRHVLVRGSSLMTFEGDRICRSTAIWDVAAMLRGLGLLPEL